MKNDTLFRIYLTVSILALVLSFTILTFPASLIVYSGYLSLLLGMIFLDKTVTENINKQQKKILRTRTNLLKTINKLSKSKKTNAEIILEAVGILDNHIDDKND